MKVRRNTNIDLRCNLTFDLQTLFQAFPLVALLHTVSVDSYGQHILTGGYPHTPSPSLGVTPYIHGPQAPHQAYAPGPQSQYLQGPGYPHPQGPAYPYAPQPQGPVYANAPSHPYPYNNYEYPKHNCSVHDVVVTAEVCVPAFETVCDEVMANIKRVVDKEQCYNVGRSVCSVSIEDVDNEICTYFYVPKKEMTNAKTVSVSFNKDCVSQMVTVCQPGGYGYSPAYGHNYCKEVAQETCYNVPIVTIVTPEVEVEYPEPEMKCVNKQILLPRITCEDITEEKCITVPEVNEDVEVIEKCITRVAEPNCQTVDLTLPKQVCVEIVYGYAHDQQKPKETAQNVKELKEY